MDWAEDKYEVSFTLFSSLTFLTRLLCQWSNSGSYLYCRNSSLLKSKWCSRSSSYTSRSRCSGPCLTKRYFKVPFKIKGLVDLLEFMLNSASLLKGSRWTLQATTMNGNFVSLVITPTINICELTKACVHVLIMSLCLQGVLVIQPDQMQVS